MSNNTDAKGALAGTVGGYGGEATINALTDIVVGYRKSSTDAAANSAVALDQFFVNPYPFPLRIVSAVIKPDGSVALSANAAGISLNVDDAAGGAQATAYFWSTASGIGMVPSGAPTGTVGTGFVNRVPAQGSGVATASILNPGAAMYLNVAKLASGVTLPSFQMNAVLRRV